MIVLCWKKREDGQNLRWQKEKGRKFNSILLRKEQGWTKVKVAKGKRVKT